MKKLLVVYNTCGISRRENTYSYVDSINSILNQEFDSFDTVISCCLNSEYTKQILQQKFGNKTKYNFIEEVLPINVTFNHSCLECVKRFGEYEGYLYIDSGVTLSDTKTLQNLYEVFKSGPYGMVAARADTDTGSDLWFGMKHDNELFKENNFIVPIGKAVNLHCQIFSNKLFQYYNRLMPDIFASYCTESIFSFLCAALNTKWVVSKDVIIHHVQAMDVGSAGFPPLSWRDSGKQLYEHPFIIDSILARLSSEEARSLGMGYEECQQIVMHNPECYDENNFCKNSHLKEWIRDNCFLKKEELDYNLIKHKFI